MKDPLHIIEETAETLPGGDHDLHWVSGYRARVILGDGLACPLPLGTREAAFWRAGFETAHTDISNRARRPLF